MCHELVLRNLQGVEEKKQYYIPGIKSFGIYYGSLTGSSYLGGEFFQGGIARAHRGTIYYSRDDTGVTSLQRAKVAVDLLLPGGEYICTSTDIQVNAGVHFWGFTTRVSLVEELQRSIRYIRCSTAQLSITLPVLCPIENILCWSTNPSYLAIVDISATELIIPTPARLCRLLGTSSLNSKYKWIHEKALRLVKGKES